MKRKISVFILSAVMCFCAAVCLLDFGDDAYAERSETSVIEVNPGDESFVLGGDWQYPEIASTNTAGNTVSYTGTFTHIAWYGQADDYMGTTSVKIDGAEVTKTKPNRGESGDCHVIYQSDVLERGRHTFTLECTGDGWLSVQKLVVTDDPQQNVIKRTYDDTSADITYNGFGGYSGQEALYEGTVHSTNAAGSTATLTVTDVKRFVLYTDRGYMRGKAEVYIDGILTDTSDLFDGVNMLGSYISYVSPELPMGEHTLEWRCTGTKSKNATDVWVTLDRIDVYLWREPIKTYDFDDTCFGYSGEWKYFGNEADAYYMNSAHSTQNAGDEMTAVFSGVEGIRIYASQAPDRTSAEVYLNGRRAGVINERNVTVIPSGIVWDSGELPNGDYELKVVVRSGNIGDWFEIDKIQTFGNALVLSRGQSAVAVLKGTFATLRFVPGKTGVVDIFTDGDFYKTLTVEEGAVDEKIDISDDGKFHRIEIVAKDGAVALNCVVTDDITLETLKAYMITHAKAEIEQRVDGTRTVSDPENWSSVAYAADKATSGGTPDG